MAPPDRVVADIAHVIQLSVAPVFLISGIGSMLGVMTNRLARVVDRARALEARLAAETPGPSLDIDAELAVLSRRAKWIHISITLCTITALLICAVVATLFLAAFLDFDASVPIALFFIGGMLSFFSALVTFLREIFTATAGLRFGKR